jgi:hypothetical protein
MKVSASSKGYTISGINAGQLNTVMHLLGTLKDRCFREREKNGEYYDGGDFVATLTEDELRGFYHFVDGFWGEYHKMKANLNLKGR